MLGHHANKQSQKGLMATAVAAMAALACILVTSTASARSREADRPKIAASVQCTTSYTHCVLSCNKQSVSLSAKLQNATSRKSKDRWSRSLDKAQIYCIPQCYQVHCIQMVAKANAKTKVFARIARK